MSDATRTRVLSALIVGGLAAAIVMAVLPDGSILVDIVYLLVSIGACVALGMRALSMPGEARGVWVAIWIFLLMDLLGDAVVAYQSQVIGVDPFPGWADLFFLGEYLAILAGLALLLWAEHPGFRREAAIDAAVMAIAATCLLVTFVLHPLEEGATDSPLETVLALTFPVLDIVIVAVLVRLLLDSGIRNGALGLLAGGFLIFFVADTVGRVDAIRLVMFASTSAHEALYLLATCLIAASAFVTGARNITKPSMSLNMQRPTRRIILISVSALTAPVLLAFGGWSHGGSLAQFLSIASIVVIVLVLWRLELILRTAYGQAEQLAQQARSDALTGIPNRRSWDFALERAVQSAAAEGTALTVAMLDLDRFKDYNDRYGHQAGDRLLVACTRAWREQIVAPCFLARYGGEEFGVLLPGLSAAEAREVLTGLRLAVPEGQTVSIGYAACQEGDTGLDVVHRADIALYSAKAAGRDRVVAS